MLLPRRSTRVDGQRRVAEHHRLPPTTATSRAAVRPGCTTASTSTQRRDPPAARLHRPRANTCLPTQSAPTSGELAVSTAHRARQLNIFRAATPSRLPDRSSVTRCGNHSAPDATKGCVQKGRERPLSRATRSAGAPAAAVRPTPPRRRGRGAGRAAAGSLVLRRQQTQEGPTCNARQPASPAAGPRPRMAEPGAAGQFRGAYPPPSPSRGAGRPARAEFRRGPPIDAFRATCAAGWRTPDEMRGFWGLP